ncbi:MAG: PBP1A family penicillin-binding protein [Steroidobacteraceae bacterium]
MKRSSFALLRYTVVALLGVAWIAVVGVAGAYVYLAESLPSSESMKRVELQVPMRIYTRSGQLIAQIGEQRRIPVTYDEIPELVRQAVLAAEDDRFFSHHGVDWEGVVRAVLKNMVGQSQGGSTITMQAARNMFLTLDKTARRKLSEVFVTFRMERDFTKEQILSTYLNVIFFGQRSYGIAAAAETFYGKRLDELTVGQAATLAGIVQLPTRYNPVTSPQYAQVRRNYVLRRMTELGYIDAATADKARKESVASRGFAPLYDVEAPYVAELARQELIKRYGPESVNAGYKVFTTLDGRLQTAANRALRLGLVEYDRRHGYRGPLAQVRLPSPLEPAKLDALIGARESVGMLLVAVVTKVDGQTAKVYIRGRGDATIEWDGLSWARPVKNDRMGAFPKKAADVLAPGDVIHVVADRRGNALLAQVPEAQGALVAVDPQDGAIVSMVGGFDYYTNKFNRVTQARRQPGSGFKPFLYSAALEHGLTPASIVLDTPIVVDDANVEGTWRPENSSREFGGPTPLRTALYRSRNLVSIRILRDIGIDTAIEHASLFGFDPAVMPHNLTLALGTLAATPLQVATGYATFANGGYHVEPYLIDRIENAASEVQYQAAPLVVCPSCEPPAPPPAELQPGEEAPAIDGSAAPMLPEASTAEIEAAARFRALMDKRAQGVPPGLAVMAENTGGRGFLPPDRVAPRVISAGNAWLMSDILSDVIKRGTGVRARVLNRNDISGKTGTTDNSRDAWFNGFNPRLVASTWLGFDEEKSLGDREEGSSTAVPVWVHFMREALRGVPDVERPMPPGVVRLRVSPRTGALTDANDPDAVSEAFLVDHLPPAGAPGGSGPRGPGVGGPGDPLF